MMEKDPKRIKPATHAGAFSMSTRTKLCAIVDTEQSQLEKAVSLFPGVPAFSDVGAMLKECEPDIVSIAVPPELHRAVVERCAETGVGAIVCEKPIAIAYDDGKAIIESCSKHGSILFVNHQRRFDPLLMRTARQVQEGRIGKLLAGTAGYVSGVYNSGTHLVDLLRFITGREVEWVSTRFEGRFPAPKGDTNVSGWVMFKDGLLFNIQAFDVNSYYVFNAQMYGTKGALGIDKLGYTCTWTAAQPSDIVEGYMELDSASRTTEGRPRSFFAPMVDHVVDCLEGRARPSSTGEDGLRALGILDAMVESAKLDGKTIYLGEGEIKG